MGNPAKETVIIVHGTWAAPEPGVRRWYQPLDGVAAEAGFVGKLDAALRQRGSPARCWAHCSPDHRIFSWSRGENSWIARTSAASALSDYVAKLREGGWRCHIVAHSHGGNVVAEALPRIMSTQNSNEPLGSVVTLGTPFMDTVSPILKRIERNARLLNVLTWIAVAVLLLGLAGFITDQWMKHSVSNGRIADYVLDWRHLAPIIMLFVLVVALFVRGGGGRGWDQQRGIPDTRLRFLAIGSPTDEAWQILHHMRNSDSPLAVRTNLISYLFLSLRSQLSRSAEVARIHGAKSFRDLGLIGKLAAGLFHVLLHLSLFAIVVTLATYVVGRVPDEEAPDVSHVQFAAMGFSIALTAYLLVLFLTKYLGEDFHSAFLSPYRRYARVMGSLAIVLATHTVTYVVRRKGWSVLRGMAMGLEGYSYQLPDIDVRPRSDPAVLVEYEDLPKGAEQRALERRSAWISRHLGHVTETFSKLAVTAADIVALLRMVEADQDLVHAAYYTDDECIARVADWIAGVQPAGSASRVAQQSGVLARARG